jgi:phosphatidylserine decarboxylase
LKVLIETIRQTLAVRIHRAGWPFIAGFAIGTVLLLTQSTVLGALGLLATGWCVYFFRDPERLTPVRDGLVVSAADGIVTGVVLAQPPPGLGMPDTPHTRVSVFLSVFDVHVNRIPIDGTVSGVVYTPGRFVNAALDKASEDNERNALRIDMDDGTAIAVVQIAGLIARRISCWVRDGGRVRAGERFGLIRFGSRVDVYLPDGVTPLVAVGQRCIAGETVIADRRCQEPPRQAERR